MTLPEALLLANAAATWYMCGVIAFVQVVHYPLFRDYARDGFRASMLAHQHRTSRVVGPAMLIESVTALLLLRFPPPGVPEWMPWTGAALVGVWATSTLWVQIPLHERLSSEGFSSAVHDRLVRTNRVRTWAWTLRGLLCLVMLASPRG